MRHKVNGEWRHAFYRVDTHIHSWGRSRTTGISLFGKGLGCDYPTTTLHKLDWFSPIIRCNCPLGNLNSDSTESNTSLDATCCAQTKVDYFCLFWLCDVLEELKKRILEAKYHQASFNSKLLDTNQKTRNETSILGIAFSSSPYPPSSLFSPFTFTCLVWNVF